MSHPNPLREIIVGAAAGVGAAWVMNQFQAGWSRYGEQLGLPPAPSGEGQTAPEDAAQRVAIAATGEPLPPTKAEAGAETVHYLTGAAIGAAYGVLATSLRGATIGAGVPLGAFAYLLLDQKVVPELRLGGSTPQDADKDQIYAVASHIVFGIATDALRRVLGGR